MLGSILVQVGADISQLTQGLQQAGGQLRNFGSSASHMGGQIAGTFGTATAAVAGGLGAAVMTAADFDTAMRKAGAVAGASASELDAMKDSALALGASTSQSASGVATAMQEMAAKGYTANEIIASMPGVISAAEASGEDLALAADTVSTALNIFGMEASESGKVADILAQTANSTAAGIGDMSYALKYAGAPAAALGISLEETSAAIGLMTNAGMDGSSAGTALRASLYALLNPSEANSKAMDALGFSIVDNEGKMKSISEIIAGMTEATAGMTDAQKTAAIASFVGTEASSGFLALMKEGPASIDAMTASLEGSAGASAKTAEEMKAGIGGAIDGMKGAIETFAIMIGNQLVPYIQQAADFISVLVNKFNDASPRFQQLATMGAVVAAALLGIVAVGGTLVFLVGSVITAFGAISGVIGTVVGAFTAGGAAAGTLGTVFAALTGPIGIAVAAIAGLVAVFVTAYKKCEWFRDMVNTAWSAISSAAVKAFGALKTAVTESIGAIVSFGQQQLSVFTSLWSEHGSTISALMKGVLSVLSVLFTASFGLIKTTVVTAWNVIKGATTVVWAFIKASVSTAVNLLAGTIRTVMSLIKGDWSGAWNSIKQTASNIIKGIVSAFKGVDLKSIGKNIIQGLINGISGMAKNVGAKIKEIASSIPDGMKKLLGIHSPSRVLRDQVGKWIPAGIAVGMENGLGQIAKAAGLMSSAAIPSFKQDLQVAERERKAAQQIIAKAIGADAAELNKIRTTTSKDAKKIESDAAAKITKIKQDAAKKVKSITKNSKTSTKEIYADMNAKIKAIETKKAADLVKIDEKMQKDVNKITASTNADKMKALKEYAEAQKQSGNLTLKQEAEFWKHSATAFKAGTKENTEALKQFNKASDDLNKERFENEKAWIESRKNMSLMSLREEVVAYNEFMKGYQKGTEEYNHFQKAAADTRKTIADKLVSVNEDYVSRMGSISDRLLDNEQRVSDEYNKALESRYSAIKGYYSLFDEVKESERVDSSTLTNNLSQQVNALSEWQSQLQGIQQRGISSALFDELASYGVEATEQLKALNRMTDAELTQYAELYEQKMQVAYAQAVRELAPMKDATEKEIKAMREAATKEIQQLQHDWQAEIIDIVHGTSDTFTQLKDVGAYAIEGLRDGMLSMSGELKSAATSLAQIIEDSIRGTLQVHSPSRLLRGLGIHAGTGLELGLYDTEAQVAKAATALADAATPNVSPVDFSGYTSGVSSVMETKLQAQFKDDAKQRQGDFVLQVDGFELARTQKSHISGMMNRDTALRTKVRGL